MKIHLSKDFSIPAIDYAIQGNGILGLKEAGKTVTAKKCAEGLLNAGMPIVAFDPSGVWKYLRVKKEGQGYPVVAVGTVDCDIPLSEDTISDVLLAAREKNISLVIDLFSNRNKSQWRRIVGSIVDTLMDHNAKYGLCHLFIEEAREFAPQRVVRDLGVIYGKIESLCAVGGNSSVGYTLINQRAEDVNKSILELCERMIIHNQSGKNSLKGMEEWFTRSRIEKNVLEEIMASLPRLESGECWVLSHTKHEPTRINVSALETIHPDRRKPETQVKIQKLGTDVSSFVSEIKRMVEKKIPVQSETRGVGKIKQVVVVPEPAPTNAEVELWKSKALTFQNELVQERRRSSELESVINGLKTYLAPQYQALQRVFTDLNSVESNGAVDHGKYAIWFDKLNAGEKKLLELLIEKKKLSAQQMIVLSGLNRESVRIYMNKLVRVHLASKPAKGEYELNENL